VEFQINYQELRSFEEELLSQLINDNIVYFDCMSETETKKRFILSRMYSNEGKPLETVCLLRLDNGALYVYDSIGMLIENFPNKFALTFAPIEKLELKLGKISHG
jgi:hypothetical protein